MGVVMPFCILGGKGANLPSRLHPPFSPTGAPWSARRQSAGNVRRKRTWNDHEEKVKRMKSRKAFIYQALQHFIEHMNYSLNLDFTHLLSIIKVFLPIICTLYIVLKYLLYVIWTCFSVDNAMNVCYYDHASKGNPGSSGTYILYNQLIID